jgi:hypothetical protein
MAKRLSRSHMEREGSDINHTHRILINSVNNWFNDKKYSLDIYFFHKSWSEIEQIRITQLSEVEKYTVFDITASIEAMFRIDYNIRCEEKLRDDLSKDFRKTYKTIKNKVRLQEDILAVWRKYNPQNRILNELRTIFQYRHWITHGRYWRINDYLSRKYDFNYLYMIYMQIKRSFNLYTL